MAIKDILGKLTGAVEKGTETIDKVAAGEIKNIADWGQMFYVFKIVFWIIILFVFCLLMWHWFFRFNKRVLVKKLKGNAVIDSYMDRGRIMTDSTKKIKLTLLKTRKTCPVPSYKYTSKMGKLDFYELYLDEKGNLHPICDQPVIDQVQGWVKSDKNIDFHILSAWRLEEMKIAEEKFRQKTFLQKHLPEILVFMSMVICGAIVWITMKGITSGMFAVSQSISEMAKGLASLR